MNTGGTLKLRSAKGLNLRAGDWVEVRTADEILATLDDAQSLEGLPFMPEMLRHCGKRFRVSKSAHKTCDTIETYTIRRMANAVHLEDLRCGGEAHGGCQAGCLLFWKEAWLKCVSGPPDSVSSSSGSSITGTSLDVAKHVLATLERGIRPAVGQGGSERYRCQTTELLKATTEVRRRDRWDPRFYLKDLTSGNVTTLTFVRYGVLAAFNAFFQRWRGRRYPYLAGLAGQKTPSESLNLQPGDLVQVRSKEEIMTTLNSGLRNRGLSFDVEMLRFCDDGTFRVLRRVEQIINEKTGEMMKLPGACVILDGVTCSGNLSTCRMFCPRSVYPYWREVWLRRAAR